MRNEASPRKEAVRRWVMRAALRLHHRFRTSLRSPPEWTDAIDLVFIANNLYVVFLLSTKETKMRSCCWKETLRRRVSRHKDVGTDL